MRGVLRFGKFNLVGLLGAILQLLLFYLMNQVGHLPAPTATVIAVEMAILHNYVWHERFTWRDREPINFRQRTLRLCRFHAGNGLVSLAGNAALIYAFVEWLRVPAVISAAAAIALCAPANFLLADRWVYGE